MACSRKRSADDAVTVEAVQPKVPRIDDAVAVEAVQPKVLSPVDELLMSVRDLPLLCQVKILAKWGLGNIAKFETYEEVCEFGARLDVDDAKEMKKKWGMVRANKRMEQTNLPTVHKHLVSIVYFIVFVVKTLILDMSF